MSKSAHWWSLSCDMYTWNRDDPAKCSHMLNMYLHYRWKKMNNSNRTFHLFINISGTLMDFLKIFYVYCNI